MVREAKHTEQQWNKEKREWMNEKQSKTTRALMFCSSILEKSLNKMNGCRFPDVHEKPVRKWV